jgi:hypothetical protein
MRKYSTNRKYSSTSSSKRIVTKRKSEQIAEKQSPIKQVYENIINFVGDFFKKLKK